MPKLVLWDLHPYLIFCYKEKQWALCIKSDFLPYFIEYILNYGCPSVHTNIRKLPIHKKASIKSNVVFKSSRIQRWIYMHVLAWGFGFRTTYYCTCLVTGEISVNLKIPYCYWNRNSSLKNFIIKEFSHQYCEIQSL